MVGLTSVTKSPQRTLFPTHGFSIKPILTFCSPAGGGEGREQPSIRNQKNKPSTANRRLPKGHLPNWENLFLALWGYIFFEVRRGGTRARFFGLLSASSGRGGVT